MNAGAKSLALDILVRKPYTAAFEQVQTALKAAGLEIVAEINLAELLAKKAQAYIRPHKIIVICDPDLAHRALTVAPQVGSLLPCNVAVSQVEDNLTRVAITDPLCMWGIAFESHLKPIAEELSNRLERVIEVLKK